MQNDSLQGYRLSAQQEWLWQLQEADGGPGYRVSCTVAIDGALPGGALEGALRGLVDRYEILRTTFQRLPGLELPLQVVAETLAPMVRHHDWSGIPEAEQASRMAALAEEMARLPFDPAAGPQVHAAIVTLGPARRRLLLELPALCADAPSLDGFLTALGAALAGGDAGEEPAQYIDISEWQSELLESPASQEGRRFWQGRAVRTAAGLGARLPWEEEGGGAAGPFAPRELPVPLSPDLAAGLAALAGEAGAPVQAVLLAAWNVLLDRLAGSAAAVVGVAAGGRSYSELQGSLGPLTRYLPFALEARETEPFLGAVARAARQVAELERWQEYFRWDPPAEGGRPYLPFGFEWIELPARYGTGAVSLAVERLSACVDRFALKLSCLRRGEELALSLGYDESAGTREHAERVAGWLLALLGGATATSERAAGDLPLLSEAERLQLDELSRTAVEHGRPETLDGLFAAQAELTPDRVALVAGPLEMSYGELRRRASHLAGELRRLGVGPEVRVGLAVERSAEMVIGMLGILAAGGAYVPLDPDYPLERQRFVLRDSRAAVLLTTERLAERLPAPPGGVICLDRAMAGPVPEGATPPASRPEHLAYVIYTSGSTGQPKGVMVTHRAITNRLSWMQRLFPLTPDDRVLQKTAYSFDASIWEVFVPLLAGARLVLAEPGAQRDPFLLAEAIAAHGVTVLQLVPSQVPGLLAVPDLDRVRASLRRLFCGGEALPGALAREVAERLGVELHNLYGPTEAAIDATCRPFVEAVAGMVAIGRPLDNVEVFVADDRQRLVPPGLPGELLIGGRGLARGYLGRPELTAERFVPHPWSGRGGERLYRTGDLVRFGPGGEIWFLGRLDHQVKVRGFRIELGEIEAALLSHPWVRETAVVVREETAGDARLIAYVAGEGLDSHQLFRLPNGMEVAYLNRGETEVVYRETFGDSGYLKHGIRLDADATVFDVGANIGLFSLWVKANAPHSRIYAFEPIPPIFEVLRTNMLLYGLDVDLVHCGLMSRDGTARFGFYPQWSAMSGAYADPVQDEAVTREILRRDSELASQADDLLAGRFRQEVFDCPVRTLSQVIRERSLARIDLLKIDVEKAELDVLRGLADEDWGKIHQIVIEVHDFDERVEQMRRLLEDRGFVVTVDQDPELAGTGMYNLYAVHPLRQSGAAPVPASAEPRLAMRLDLSPQGLRDYLAERLPQHMVPQAFVILEALPRQPNGKLDRRALPEPGAVVTAPVAELVAPRNPVEEIVAGLWAEVLQVERVGAHDDFFELGGHSLLATQMIARVRECFRVEIKIRALFEASTVARFAAAIEAARRGPAGTAAPPIQPVPRGGELPLSFSQQRLWFLEQLEGHGAVYNLPTALLLTGPLDVAALRAALDEIVSRHEPLRTRFPTVEGRPVQEIAPPGPTPLPLVDLRHLAEGERWRELRAITAENTLQPFDLAQGPLLRAALVRLADAEHAVLLTLHHTISDGSSFRVFVDELVALYGAFTAGRPSPLPPLPIQLADYAVWQRGWLTGPVLEAELGYWRGQLAGAPPLLELPADHPRPAVQSFAGQRQPFAVAAGLTGDLRALGHRRGATLFMTLLGAFQALLSRYSGQEDVPVGTPIANRHHPQTERLIGCFANTLVLRTELSGDPSFEELLGRVREVALGAYAHQDMPFEMLVNELQPERDLSRSPLFQVFFSLLGAPRERPRLAGIEVRQLPIESRTSRFDLSCDLYEGREGLSGSFEHSTALFEPASVERLAGHYHTLLAGAAAAPGLRLSELPLLSGTERQQLLVDWQGAALPYSDRTIHELFEERAASSPELPAVVWRGEEVSYGELDRRANRLAHRLRSLGVRADEPVGICLERSAGMVVALLAVLKAGAPYLPLDPAYPPARLALMAGDAGARVVLTEERLLPRLPGEGLEAVCLDLLQDDLAGESDRRPASGVTAGNLAYVIYTSGSTGTPKGVMVSHRNVVSFFAGMDAALGGSSPGTWLAVTSISFDISVLELLWTLTRGFRVVIQGEREVLAAATPEAAAVARPIDFSLFYFAKAESEAGGGDPYRLLLEGARFADRHGFTAVWTPERHFHDFGGLYPSPAVTSAAIATITERVQIRAGSVVLPLHHPIRVAEEWAMIDNLSRGRTGISFASGWHADDFVFAPERYARRKEAMLEGIDVIRRLWRGEAVRARGGAGREVEVRILPRPVQPELPVWVTAAGNVETFRQAGEAGAGVLTHLLGQDLDELEEKVAAYRRAWREGGHGPGDGHVVLMLHTFIGEDQEAVRRLVKRPFCNYLRSSLDLLRNLSRSTTGQEVDPNLLSAEDLEDLLERSFDRYFDTAALLGTTASCLPMVERLKRIGVDEVACLIDFGVDAEAVLGSLRHLDALRQLANRQPAAAEAPGPSVAQQIAGAGVTHLQCTPTLARLLVSDPASRSALGALERLLVGGEALPPSLLDELRQVQPAAIHNMYGPTETTVWSSTWAVPAAAGRISVGRPIANTQIHAVGPQLQPLPAGVPGELLIGGPGVTRGYHGRPDLTAERFVPDPFGPSPGGRLYRTGDRARRLPDGEIEILGRLDHQVKVHGYRIELAEIEHALERHPAIAQAVVVAREEPGGNRRLAAYFVPAAAGAAPMPSWTGRYHRLPNGMRVACLNDFQASQAYREVFESAIYLRHGITLEDGDCVFDVGANIGFFSLFASRRAKDLAIYAFEPIPVTFQALSTNVSLHGVPAEVLPVGVGERAETVQFTFYPQMPGLSGRYAGATQDREATRAILLAGMAREGARLSDAEIEDLLDEQFRSETHLCPVRTLSDVIDERGIEVIDLLKVDVERAELDVLRGLCPEHWGRVRQVAMEVDGRENLNVITELLHRHGFAVTVEDFVHVSTAGDEREAVAVFMLYARRDTPRPAGARRRPLALSAADPLSFGELRAYLAQSLPEHMLPGVFVRLAALPLTANGKVDRKALPAPVPGPAPQRDFAPPLTPVEQLLAGLWQDLLRVPRVGRHDSFFELGGDSLLSIQLIARARQVGLHLTPRQLFQHQTVAELAAVVTPVPAAGVEEVGGPVGLTPIQHWFFEQELPAPQHWNHALLMALRPGIDPRHLASALAVLLGHHDALRLRFRRDPSGWSQEPASWDGEVPWLHVDLSGLPLAARARSQAAAADGVHASLDLQRGPLVRFALFARGEGQPDLLLLVIHHLAVDGLSWRILLEDLGTALEQLAAGRSSRQVELLPVGASFSAWAEHLARQAETPEIAAELPFWLSLGRQSLPPLPIDHSGGDNLEGSVETVSVWLEAEPTRQLLQQVPAVYRTQVNDALLTALALGFAGWTGQRSLLVDLEGHGREEVGGYLDVSRTVGWFSTFFPVLLDLGGAGGPGEALKTVKEQLRRIPNRGVGYGLLRYGRPDGAAARQLRTLPASLVSFNYLGQLDQAAAVGSSPFLPAAEPSGTARDPRQPRRYLLDVNGEVRGGRLRLGLTYSRGLFAAATIERLAAACMAELRGLIAHCLSPEAGGPTPSDFPLVGLDQAALDRLAAAHPGIDDILPLTTLQQGLLFHSLEAQGAPVYLLQLSCRVLGDLDPALFELTWQRVMERHSILRSCFVWEGLDEPLQIVCRKVHLPCQWLDWRGLDGASQELGLADLLAAHRREGLDIAQAPLMRIAMIRTGPREHCLVWTHHHLLVDAWSVAVVVAEVCALYPALAAGVEPQLPPPGSYRDYVQWQRRQSLDQAEDFWRGSLAGVTAPTSLGIDRPDGSLAAGEPTTAVLTLTGAATAELRATARRLSLTLNTLVLGAWTYLLGLLSGEEEVVLGVVSSGREADLPGIEGMVGVFINTLPLRASIRPAAPLAAWLRGLQERQVEMRRFGHTPLVEAQGWSEVPRGLPLFESIFIFQGQPVTPVSELLSGRLEVRDVQSLARTNYPLALLVGGGEELRFEAVLDGGRFDPAWADRLLGYLQRLLAAFAVDPERPLGLLPLLAESERRALLAAARETERPERCLHQIFAERAATSPEAVAVCYEGERLTYGQLNGRANRLARHLVGLGVSPGDVVGLSVERSLEMVVGILGILKAGAAYLPLDPAQPAERLAFMLDDAGVEVLLTEERLRGALPATQARVISLDAERPEIERCREDDLVLPGLPESLAYVIYTSGSTGRPKGVLVSHANVVRLLTATRELFDFDARDVWSLFHSFAFDFSVWELWGALLFGGRLVVVPYWSARVPEELYRLLVNERVTVLNQIPSAFQRLIQVDEERGDPLALRWVIFGGEALAPDTLAGWLERHGDRQPRLVNMYGITETTVHVTWREIREADVAAGGSPIGGPLPDLELYVASRFMQPVPAMVAGELYVGGAGLAWGYLGRPELTAERFVPDPWSGRPGSRLYRTGDLARRLPDGDIDYLGRTDHQIKLRGFRIELGEIEAALRRHPAVSEAIVVAGGGLLAGSAARLVAHVVPKRGQAPTAGALREWLLQELPEPMVPAAFVLRDELPRTASGKLDRRALAASGPARTAREDAAAPPRTAVEEMVAGIWAEVLHLDRVGAGDSFLALGGHSLLATQVVSRIRQTFRVDLPLRDLFEAPTLGDLAARVEALRHKAAGVVAPPLRRAVRDRDLPLSFAQQRLWFLDQLGMAGPAYHIPADLRIAGRLDVPALAHGLSEIVRRHESLRTVFPRDRQAQVVQEPRPVPLPVVDLGALPDDGARQAEMHRLAREELRRPFDLTRDLLVRAGLLRLAPEEHVLLLTLHHIASDGWSAGVLVREMAVLYPAALRGEARPLPELSIQYADYACWQRDWLRGEVLERELAYWRDRLAGAPQAVELATDRPRPAVATFGGAFVGRELPREEAAALQALARRQGVTLFMVLLAAFQALLYRRGGQRDLSIGTPVAGRNRLETEGLIGFLVNTLVLRGDLGGDPRFADLLEQARDTVLDAQAHQDLPFEKIVEVLRPERDLSRTPLFQVMLALQSSPQGEVELPGLRLQPVSVHAGASKFDLTLEAVELPAGLMLSAEHSTDLFDHGTVARLLDGFRVLLQGVAANPLSRLGDLPLLAAAERHQLLIEWGAAEAVADGSRPLHELFEAEVERRPGADVVVWLGHRLSYRELDRRANRLANCLRSLGVGPEVRVGLCAERSLDLVVGILGILKAGGAYVPLDPTYPKERLAFLVEDSRIPVVVTEEALVERLTPCGAQLLRLDADAARIGRWSEDRPASQALPDNAAYVIYTSGSTGTPKGVVVTHRNVTRLFAATRPWFQPGASDVWALFHSFAFDFSVWELWGALLHGGRLVIVPYATSRAPEAFHELLREEGVTVLNQTPSAFRQLIHADQSRPAADGGLALRLVIFGGEALDLQSLHPWLERHGEELPRLVNMYGITETTVHVTYREVGWADLAAASASVIGVPIPDLAVYVLDSAGQPVPSGVPGELYVGGAGLARGYLGRPALSAERFVPNPFGGAAGERLYRSGDLGRYRAGRRDLEYLGRVDLQVKVRGFRIEVGEIEAALGACPGVRETVVLVREDVPGEPRLVAYVVPATAEPPTAGQLRGALLDKLPDYMVPALFVMLDALPLTEHGKVDRRALPAADGAERASDEVYAAPETPLQELLVTIWAEVLGVERVGLDDNFFALGGDSMRTLRVLTMVRERGLDFPLQQIYRHQTVRELAQAIAAELSLDEAAVAVAPAGSMAPEEDLDQMLAELEGLSPDEVRAELQQELARKRGATE